MNSAWKSIENTFILCYNDCEIIKSMPRFRKGEFLLNEVLRLGHIVLVEVIEVDLSKMGDVLE
jgi:hypothetical protein